MEYDYCKSAKKNQQIMKLLIPFCALTVEKSRYEVTDVSRASVNFKEPLRERIHWLLKV